MSPLKRSQHSARSRLNSLKINQAVIAPLLNEPQSENRERSFNNTEAFPNHPTGSFASFSAEPSYISLEDADLSMYLYHDSLFLAVGIETCILIRLKNQSSKAALRLHLITQGEQSQARRASFCPFVMMRACSVYDLSGATSAPSIPNNSDPKSLGSMRQASLQRSCFRCEGPKPSTQDASVHSHNSALISNASAACWCSITCPKRSPECSKRRSSIA